MCSNILNVVYKIIRSLRSIRMIKFNVQVYINGVQSILGNRSFLYYLFYRLNAQKYTRSLFH
jgi:hypothetical protein